MWELDYKESWALKNWCFWTVVLGKTLESPLDSKEIQPVNPNRNKPWLFIRRTDAEAEAQILWPPDIKSWPIGKDPDAGKDWRQEEKGLTEDEMASVTQWTWLWANSRKWWRTGKASMLQFVGLQRIRHDLATEQHIPVFSSICTFICKFKMYLLSTYVISMEGLALGKKKKKKKTGEKPLPKNLCNRKDRGT